MQTRADFYIREKDRNAWQALKKKGLRPSEIFSRGIQLVYRQEVENEQDSKSIDKKQDVK